MSGNGMARRVALGAALAMAAAGCGDDGPAGPGGQTGGEVSLSVFVPAPGAASASIFAPAAVEITQTDGTNTLTITRVAMVLREIELKRVDDDFCEDTVSGQDDDDCEEFEVGPRLFELPLDGQVDHVVTVDGVPAGSYDELEFDIHKPDDDTPEDIAFRQAHPDFVGVSVRVEGTFNGEAFVYTSDLNEELEAHLVPPLVVGEGAASTNVTLSVDVATWFVSPGGTLVDPATALKDGVNEQLVEDNIERSIEGFEDEDGDGTSDD